MLRAFKFKLKKKLINFEISAASLTQVGDVLVEVDGEDVSGWSVEDVITRAQKAEKVTTETLEKERTL